MKVKICGITNKDDAMWSLNYGADLLGLNFYKESPRHVSVNSAEKWIGELPPFASVVGVFVNASVKDIHSAVTKLNLKGVQLHGEESPAFVQELKNLFASEGRKVFVTKAFRIKDEESVSSLSSYADSCDYFLLDAFVEGQEGGTGTLFNWELALKAKEIGKPVFLAGGLTPENVRDAVKKVSPYGVDVASGVERTPKRKDLDKVKDFVVNAKR